MGPTVCNDLNVCACVFFWRGCTKQRPVESDTRVRMTEICREGELNHSRLRLATRWRHQRKHSQTLWPLSTVVQVGTLTFFHVSSLNKFNVIHYDFKNPNTHNFFPYNSLQLTLGLQTRKHYKAKDRVFEVLWKKIRVVFAVHHILLPKSTAGFACKQQNNIIFYCWTVGRFQKEHIFLHNFDFIITFCMEPKPLPYTEGLK